MASLSRFGGAAAVLLALGACAETVPHGASSVPSSAPAVVAPPPVVATPPVAAAPLVPGSGTTLSPAVVPARLSSNEVAALVADNTVTGVAANGRPYYVYFARDGRLKYRQDDYRDGGGWRVTTDGRLCSALARINVGVEECYTIYRNGANFRYDRPDGNQIGTFAVLPGNPQNL